MAFTKLWVIAYRDLGRNRRRSILTLIAAALGLALLIVMSGYIAGVVDGALQNNIRLQTGHVQLRAATYDESKLSLLWADLLEDTPTLLAQARAMSEVRAATPVLWSSGVLSTIYESVSVRVTGIDPASPVHDPIRQGIAAGQFLTAEDRGGILIGKRLADSMEIGVGQRVSLAVGTSNERPEEGVFTIRGLFETGVPSYDDNTVFMSLSQAGALMDASGHASAIVIMLHKQDDANYVATALMHPGIQALTWEEMNSLLLEAVQAGMSFYIMMYGVVILVVAVIIANTLLMSVFERTREMGILAALGMKGRQIMLMVVLEAGTLALIGILVGILLGSAGVWYLSTAGIPIGDLDLGSSAEGIAIGTTLYAKFVPSDLVSLSIWMLAIVLLASLYPAWFAARREPINALHEL
jgi:ABC-type lipoprotein release transport system permease subunit